MSTTNANTISLEEQARQLKLAYDREWRKKNPDKVRRYNQNRWLKKAQQLIESRGE